METTTTKLRAMFLALFFTIVAFSSFVSATDSDGDGVDDVSDDCPFAAGTSTIDRQGCPDRDGDGTSDIADGWTSNNPNFSEEMAIATSNDMIAIDHDPTGTMVVAAEEDVLRIWNTTSHVNIRSTVSLVSSGSCTWGGSPAICSVEWSPDGQYIAVSLSDDTAAVLWADNLTVIHDGITHTGSSRLFSDVAFMPNSTTFAVVDETSGGGGGGCTGCSVMFVDVLSGTIWKELTPANAGSYSSVAFSEDGTRMAVGGDGEVYIVNTTSWWTTRTLTGGNQNFNAVDISPDGNMVAGCSAAGGGGSQQRAMVWDLHTGATKFTKTPTTSCYDAEFSPDGIQVAFGLGQSGSDGASTQIYEFDSNLLVDTFSTPRPSGCSGWNNDCGIHYGISWHPGGYDMALSVGRRDDGVYFIHADLDPDNDGWNSTDQGDGIVDAFPNDGTQWADQDGDGFGDNPAPANEPDACLTVWGNSTEDRFGCPDADGDGWSDEADWAPSDPKQWADADLDGYGDNYYFELNEYQIHLNQTGDAFPGDASQWNDTDGDGYGDNYADSSWTSIRPTEWPGIHIEGATTVDVFPIDRTQWVDTDGDWYGDNEISDRADGCPLVWGNSTLDRLGCLDTDGDGFSNPTTDWPTTPDCYGADAFPNDPTQWCDEDGDGFGSNPDGNEADDCPGSAGTSSMGTKIGCPDRDDDGYANAEDPFPDDPTQWEDSDGDNRGDNPDGSNPDLYPNDATQWKDDDNDGYGDNPSGTNGDQFPDDPTQWADTDGDGFGDNLEGTNGDVCPTESGDSTTASTRGCPDNDMDGYVDPIDAFPDDRYQWADSDGDGFGDNTAVDGIPITTGDDCPNEFGTSDKDYIYGCPDRDFDGYADSIDEFPDDGLQWKDTDKDGYGDNYFYTMTNITDPDNPGQMVMIREQEGDAFPEDDEQWSDVDGDGWGDNQSSLHNPDAFPYRPTQMRDKDGDGFGDNTTTGAYMPDDCINEPGTSTFSLLGCPDADEDTVADKEDNCPWDPNYYLLADQGKCTILSDPSLQRNTGEDDSLLGDGNPVMYVGGVIVFLLLAILVAMGSKAAGQRKVVKEKNEHLALEQAHLEEEERRQAWIQHYLAQGDFVEARKLGWDGSEAMPQWQAHQIQEQAAAEAAIPSMMNLEDL